jgi:predicted dinucleotide-binding enzyme
MVEKQGANMRLGVIGTDTIGTFIGSWAKKIGYEVLFSSKHLLKGTTDAQMVVEESELIFLATDFAEGKKFLNETRRLMRGKILVDVTHPHLLESAEEFAKMAPETNVVKIFNSDFKKVYSFSNPAVDEKVKSVIFFGNNAWAKKQVAEVFQKLGFDTIDAGALLNSRKIFTRYAS